MNKRSLAHNATAVLGAGAVFAAVAVGLATPAQAAVAWPAHVFAPYVDTGLSNTNLTSVRTRVPSPRRSSSSPVARPVAAPPPPRRLRRRPSRPAPPPRPRPRPPAAAPAPVRPPGAARAPTRPATRSPTTAPTGPPSGTTTRHPAAPQTPGPATAPARARCSAARRDPVSRGDAPVPGPTAPRWGGRSAGQTWGPAGSPKPGPRSSWLGALVAGTGCGCSASWVAAQVQTSSRALGTSRTRCEGA